MPQPSKEPCKKEACDIQACLAKNNFMSQRNGSICGEHHIDADAMANQCGHLISDNTIVELKCRHVIERLQSCCERCKYESTHCASVSGLLKQISK